MQSFSLTCCSIWLSFSWAQAPCSLQHADDSDFKQHLWNTTRLLEATPASATLACATKVQLGLLLLLTMHPARAAAMQCTIGYFHDALINAMRFTGFLSLR